MAQKYFRWMLVATVFGFLGAGELLAKEGAGHESIVEGNEENGVRQGFWKITLPDGSFASGHYRDGQRDGLWHETWSDGRQFAGRYQRGVRHGLWTLTPLGARNRQWQWDHRYDVFDPSRTVVEKVYMRGEPLGPWRLYFRDVVGEGDVIDSEGRIQGNWQFRSTHRRKETSVWVDGIRQGPAVIGWADGTREEGDFHQGTRSAWWVLRWSDGSVEDGSYYAGVRNGPWKIEYPDGHVEEGEYRHGRRFGTWNVRWPDGASGTAHYNANAPAKWSIERGTELEGSWELNMFGKETIAKRGLWAFVRCQRKGFYCKGRYSRDQRSGPWIQRFANGTFVRVTYWQGELIGRLEIRYPNGAVSHASYENGTLHGPLTARHPDGSRRKAVYNFGKIDGPARVIWPSGHIDEEDYDKGKLILKAQKLGPERRDPFLTSRK